MTAWDANNLLMGEVDQLSEELERARWSEQHWHANHDHQVAMKRNLSKKYGELHHEHAEALAEIARHHNLIERMANLLARAASMLDDQGTHFQVQQEIRELLNRETGHGEHR